MTDPLNPRTEFRRKLLHISSSLLGLAYLFLSRDFMLAALGLGVAFSVAVELLRYHNAAFRRLFRRAVGAMVRECEWTRVTGATYVWIGAFLTVWLFPRTDAIAGLLTLSLADSAAALVGQYCGRRPFLAKTLEGTAAFFLTALLVILLVRPEQPAVAAGAALVVTVIEALPMLRLGRFELSDNILIPLTTAAALGVLGGAPAPAGS